MQWSSCDKYSYRLLTENQYEFNELILVMTMIWDLREFGSDVGFLLQLSQSVVHCSVALPSSAVPRKCITYCFGPQYRAQRRRHQTEANWWYDSNIRLCLMYDQRRTRIWIFSTHWGMMNSQETGAHICTAVSVLSRGRKLLSLCPLNRVSCRAVNEFSRIYHTASLSVVLRT